MELDALDQLAASVFEGYIVRKDLVRRFKGQYPVPTYVAEFLLGRYCSSTDEDEIAEGLQIVERQMRERTVRAGEEELFKHQARERGTVKVIDLITARLDAGSDSYVASRQRELNIQVRAMDTAKSGAMLGIPILLAYCSAILQKSLKGGLVVVGGLSVGGSFEPIHNAVAVAEMAVEKGAQTILFPVACRRQLNDLSDDMAARIAIIYFTDVRDALLKSLSD